MGHSTPNDELADQAIDWFARLRADDVSKADRRAFFSWLATGQDAQNAFVEILKLWDNLSVVGQMSFEELADFPALYHLKAKSPPSKSQVATSDALKWTGD